MPTLTLNLGEEAATWTTYLIAYDSFDYENVWWPQQGVFTGPPTTQLFDAGSVTGAHQGSGVFTYVFPVGITQPGIYPFRVFREGELERSPTDEQLTPDGQDYSVVIWADVSPLGPFYYEVPETV